MEKEFNLDYKIEEKVVPGSGVKIADRIYINQDHEFQWPSLLAPEDDGKGFCHALRSQAAILVDGTVVPCCLDGEGVIDLGNINSTPFQKLLREKEQITSSMDFPEEKLLKKCAGSVGIERNLEDKLLPT